MIKKEIDVLELLEFLEKCGPNTKLYIGCDSERMRINEVWYADYILAVVVHIDGKHGCKIFGAVQRERDFDQKANKPRMRLVNEAYKVADLYLKLAPYVEFDIEVHLDINPDEKHNSSIAIQEAVGYIRGTCNVIPLVKPRAFAASYAADRYKEIVGHRRVA